MKSFICIVFVFVISISGCQTTGVGSLPVSGMGEKAINVQKSLDTPITVELGQMGDLEGLKEAVKSGYEINASDKWGYTALHRAVENGQIDAVYWLLENGADASINTNQGFSVINLARAYGDETQIKVVECAFSDGEDCKIQRELYYNQCKNNNSINGCSDYLSRFPNGIYSGPANNKLEQLVYLEKCRLSVIECQEFIDEATDLDLKAQAKDDLKILTDKEIDLHYQEFESACSSNSSYDVCKSFVDKYPAFYSYGTTQYSLAILKQKCRLKESGWIYGGNSCKEGFAEGRGEATNFDRNLIFDGEFKNGVRMTGLISVNGVDLYDGPIKEGRPDGVGICFYEDEPEECKFYKGKRVDAIYKQRLAFEKQRREIDEKLKLLEEKQNKKMERVQASINRQQTQVYTQSNQKSIQDVLIEEGQKRLVNEIFDRLF